MTEPPRPTPTSPDDAPSPAGGARTLLEVLEQAAAAGYVDEFVAEPEGTIACPACEHRVNPVALKPERVARLEGASDAADMVIVVCSSCPDCGDPGVLILGYGPNADDRSTAVLPYIDLGGAASIGTTES